MKVLMFGWEFPPFSVGGLGNVCYHLTTALANKGVEISLVLPMKVENKKIEILPINVSLNPVRTILSPYLNEETYQTAIGNEKSCLYGGSLKEEVERYTKECERIVKNKKFDLIHCHDWMTFKAGTLAKEISGKPLILHVHTTEFDRNCGLSCNEYAYKIEKMGFKNADKIIAVSNFLKNRIVSCYGIDGNNIEVIHNAIDFDGMVKAKIEKNEKRIVLYFGRISLHKGPDYFIKAARKVLDVYKDVIFIMAGTGELLHKMIELSCELGIADKLLFTGYLSDEEVKKIYQLADLYIMPSVSEPFGLTTLESVSNGTPVLLSKNSGVREVLKNCLLIDFWDVDDIANKVIAALSYTPMRECLIEEGYKELQNISWDEQANKVIDIYNKLK